MMSRQQRIYWAIIGAILSLALPLLGMTLAMLLFPALVMEHIPSHAVLEGVGGLLAFAIAGVLLIEVGDQLRPDTRHHYWLAASLLGMGALDIFHAASIPGNSFVFLRSMATFTGGLFCAGIWLSRWTCRARWLGWLPSLALAFALIISLATYFSDAWEPIVITGSPGAVTFTAWAWFLNITGGMGFWVAAAFFITRYLHTDSREDWLFALQSALFGMAGLLFAASSLWDGTWWWWHLLRVGAYFSALSFGLQRYFTAEREMRRLNRELAAMNHSLDATVEQRTAKLRASEERFELAVRGSSDGLWDFNPRTKEVYYSDRFKELIGFPPEEFPGVLNSFLQQLHPEDLERVMGLVKQHLEERVPYDVQYRLRTKQGEYRWFRARGQAVWNEAGVAVRMAGSITDITEQELLKERFEIAVWASPIALLMVNSQGRIALANPRAAELFRYSEAEMLGMEVDLLLPERFRGHHAEQRAQFVAAGASRQMGAGLELIALRKDGTEFPTQIGLAPVKTEAGSCVMCVVSDISNQKVALAVMQQAKEAAESASRAKSSFLANMSHEIRTPMNGIIGMSQLLVQTELNSRQHDYLSTIHESAHVLLKLLNDILDFSKIEAGKLELEIIDFQLSECVARAMQILAFRAAEKGLELACRISPEIPDFLRGDPSRLQQVLVNLISNAIKFTDFGEIYVNVNAEKPAAERVVLSVSVSDTGIGISPEKLEQIFHPFEQAESSITRRFGGTGLGLTISRQLVELMHGKLWVESEPGRGSTFHFVAEFVVAADQHRRPPVKLASLTGLEVLVVDDNATNRRIFKELLDHWKMHPHLVDSAAAGREAVDNALSVGQPFRLILLDHAMPGEDGLHFAESIASNVGKTGCHIIMISSAAKLVDAARCALCGIERIMSKPVIASDLLGEILRIFGQHSLAGDELPPIIAAVEQVQPRKILLVEDNEINRRVALGMLQSRGHQVTYAENGQVAVEKLAGEEFDVVLMDMQMPVMDGYTATQRIRTLEHETGGHTPIVAMTAEALKGDRERCLAAGMDDYLAKPIHAPDLYRVVEQFAALAQKTYQEVRPLDTHATSVEESPPFDHALDATSPVVDWNIARQQFGESPQMLAEFIALLQQQAPQLLSDIRSALDSQDAKRLTRAAHTLKSSVLYFGAERASQAAMSLELLGRDANFAAAESEYPRLAELIAEVLTAMEQGPQ